MKTIYLIMLMVFTGCGVFNRSAKTDVKSFENADSMMDMHTHAQSAKMKDSQQMIFRKDSAGMDYTLRFWPKGTFNFSANGAFSGQFDSIVMTGKQKTMGSTTAFAVNKEQEKVQLSEDLNHNVQIKTGTDKREKMTVPDWKVIFGILVIIFFVIYWLGKRAFLILK